MSMKKRHLIVLIFIIILPILTISRIWDELIKNEREVIQCRFERSLMLERCEAASALTYEKGALPLPDYTKHLVWVGLSLSFFILGGYFFWEFLKLLSVTQQKVSFVNHVSHELKTPLTNLRLYIDLLKGQVGDQPEQQKKLAVLEQECGRLTRLVDNLLLFSYGGQLHLNRQDHDIDEIIEALRTSYEVPFAQKGLRIVTEGRAGRAQVDRGVLEQILVNLLGNAEKYAAGGGFVKISARKDDGGRVFIRVEDAGPGIPPELQKQVFMPFARVYDQNLHSTGGMGIGLPLARNLARAHGGDLVLIDAPKGACFEVCL